MSIVDYVAADAQKMLDEHPDYCDNCFRARRENTRDAQRCETRRILENIVRLASAIARLGQ